MDPMTKRVLEAFLVALISWALTRYVVRPAVKRVLAKA
jgi:hypothetical protein